MNSQSLWSENSTGRKSRKTLNSNDRNQVADLRLSLKKWFAAGAYSCGLRRTGSAHCYLRISENLQRFITKINKAFLHLVVEITIYHTFNLATSTST